MVSDLIYKLITLLLIVAEELFDHLILEKESTINFLFKHICKSCLQFPWVREEERVYVKVVSDRHLNTLSLFCGTP